MRPSQPGTRRPSVVRVRYTEPAAAGVVARGVVGSLGPFVDSGRPLLFLCIGSDRSTGDALGPLVGSKLAEGWACARAEGCRPPLQVVGTLDAPVHAANLVQTVHGLEHSVPRPLVVAIDACLGPAESVGTVTVGPGPLRPGAGVRKVLPQVGDCYVTGTVNVGGFMEYLVLQNTRLSLVMAMATVIAEGIAAAVTRLLAGRDEVVLGEVEACSSDAAL